MSDMAIHRNALPPGAELMEYRLDAILGAGGFGLTYLAWDAHLHKRVALKEYLPSDIALRALDGSIVPVATQRLEDYHRGLERFLEEARTLARFSHPHIVRVYRYFEANNTAYMVMGYEHGESLSGLLRRDRYPSEERLRAILLPVLDGLRAVHEAGFLHRDIKPSNIFLREQGGPLLGGFGAVRHTVGGSGNYTAVVTPGYAPIEQYCARSSEGAWSDIYAVAGVIYRAVTNENPPDAVGRMHRDTVAALLYAARERYSPALLCAIGWGLEIEHHRRPQTVAEWQGGLLGRARVPYELRDPTADCRGACLTRVTAERIDVSGSRYAVAYRWTVPLAVGIGVLVWRAYDRDAEETHVPPAPNPVGVISAMPPRETAFVPPPARQLPSTPPQAHVPREKAAAADRRRAAGRAVATTEVSAEESHAPMHDAVALPALVDVTRDRPGRERSSRPATER